MYARLLSGLQESFDGAISVILALFSRPFDFPRPFDIVVSAFWSHVLTTCWAQFGGLFGWRRDRPGLLFHHAAEARPARLGRRRVGVRPAAALNYRPAARRCDPFAGEFTNPLPSGCWVVEQIACVFRWKTQKTQKTIGQSSGLRRDCGSSR